MRLLSFSTPCWCSSKVLPRPALAIFGNSLWLCADHATPSLPRNHSRDIACFPAGRPSPCPGFSGGGSWFLSRGRLQRHEYKSEKSTLWQTCGRFLTRRETCGMWFESQMKRSNWIFLGLNLREEGRKFRIGTLWAAVLSSRNNHRLAPLQN